MDTDSTNENPQPETPEVDSRALRHYETIGLKVFAAGALALPASIFVVLLGSHLPAAIHPVLSNVLSLGFMFSVLSMPVTFLAAFINIFILIYDHAPLRSQRVAATAGVLVGSIVVEAVLCLILALGIILAMENAMNPH